VKVGTVVITPPFAPGNAGPWICAAVVVPIKPEKSNSTWSVLATLSNVINPVPVPGEALGVTTYSPERSVEILIIVAVAIPGSTVSPKIILIRSFESFMSSTPPRSIKLPVFLQSSSQLATY
jgi:hypothetical protein